MSTYVGGKEAGKLLGVHQQTLRTWDEKGILKTIRTPGGKRLYDVKGFIKAKECKDDIKCLEDLDKLDKIKGKLSISYARVSSLGQKDDLERQKRMLIRKYPKNILIQDIGSGINLNKKGLKKIIHMAIEGRIKILVVAYKDRLVRFGYELIEDLITTYSDGKIVILNKVDDKEPEEQLAYDVLQVMNVFVAKMNGLRKYKISKKKAKSDNDSDTE